MRKSSFLLTLTVGPLMLALSSVAAAQDAPQQAAHTASGTMPQPSSFEAAQKAAPDGIFQPEQPMSLGELARLARAKKTSQPKAVKIFDDENMPRAPISAGEKAPDIAGHGSSAGAKVTLLDFWATWCGPCRHALPSLKQLQAAYRGNELEVISISEDEDEGAWHDFVAQNQMNWTQRIDQNHQMMRQFGASSLPTYILIGKDGKVLRQYVGDDPGEPILERIGPDLKNSL
jgi:thiol-disulfide isomerase/thioredoxin